MKNSWLVNTCSDKPIKLFCHDCMMGMKEITSESVSVIVTSPPYNLSIRYNSYQDDQPRKEYLNWIEKWCVLIKRILQPQGSLFLNIGSSPKDPWIPFDVGHRIRKYLTLQNTFHWIKNISIDEEYIQKYNRYENTVSLGHYKPINSKRFVNDCHEYIFHFTREGNVPIQRKAIGVPYQDKSNIRRWNSSSNDIRCRGNNWFIPYETIKFRSKDRPHPATFPVKLVENCIKLHGTKNIDLMLDPFLGIGSSAIAAIHMDVPFIGFEIDSFYFDVAMERLRNEMKSRKNPTLF